MRCVVEGQSSHEKSESDEDDEPDGKKWQAKPGVVYRLAKGQLKVLEGGMGQYEAIAERATSKLMRV